MMNSAVRAVNAYSMAVVVRFEPPLDVPFAGAVIEPSDGAVVWAGCNPGGQQGHWRGSRLNDKRDTWTLVSSPAWARKIRPKYEGSWDKKRAGNDIVAAFGAAVGIDIAKRHRVTFLCPTFHWTGTSPITTPNTGMHCLLDRQVGLGWCGDIFADVGPEAAVESGNQLGQLIATISAPEVTSLSDDVLLPGKGGWTLRQATPELEDTRCIVGSEIGRESAMWEKEELDDLWSGACDIAVGKYRNRVPRSGEVDSFKSYRKLGVLSKDRARPRPPGAGADATAENPQRVFEKVQGKVTMRFADPAEEGGKRRRQRRDRLQFRTQ